MSFNSPSCLSSTELLGTSSTIFLERGVVQRTSLLTSTTSRSGDNLAILLERPPEYHDPPVCLEFEREITPFKAQQCGLGSFGTSLALRPRKGSRENELGNTVRFSLLIG